jgi:hypothetical protein
LPELAVGTRCHRDPALGAALRRQCLCPLGRIEHRIAEADHGLAGVVLAGKNPQCLKAVVIPASGGVDLPLGSDRHRYQADPSHTGKSEGGPLLTVSANVSVSVSAKSDACW